MALPMMAGPGKPGPKPPKKQPCGWCGGSGTVPTNPSRPRDGEAVCHRCGGAGEL